MLSQSERATLLQVARDAIRAHLSGARIDLPASAGPLIERRGAFVSLHKHGELRGCIGHIEPDQPLAEAVARCAVSAATSDPRFDAVDPRELTDMNLEISVLGPLAPVRSLDEVEVGRDGLVVEMGWQRGLLLPQVATEWGWDRETFVAHTCRKAGLPADAVRRGAKLWKFEAEVFSDVGAP